jgi:hypothetical protein
MCWTLWQMVNTPCVRSRHREAGGHERAGGHGSSCGSPCCACSSKRLKEDVNDGSLRGLLASHGVVAYLCGHLHGLFGQRQHLLHLGVGAGGAQPLRGPSRPCTQGSDPLVKLGAPCSALLFCAPLSSGDQ